MISYGNIMRYRTLGKESYDNLIEFYKGKQTFDNRNETLQRLCNDIVEDSSRVGETLQTDGILSCKSILKELDYPFPYNDREIKSCITKAIVENRKGHTKEYADFLENKASRADEMQNSTACSPENCAGCSMQKMCHFEDSTQKIYLFDGVPISEDIVEDTIEKEMNDLDL